MGINPGPGLVYLWQPLVTLTTTTIRVCVLALHITNSLIDVQCWNGQTLGF